MQIGTEFRSCTDTIVGLRGLNKLVFFNELDIITK